MSEMLGGLSQAYQKSYPGRKVCFSLPSTRAAPIALADHRSDLAPMGAEMTDDDLMLFRQHGDPRPLAVKVAHDSLKPGAISSPTGVFVQRANPLRQISLAQLRAIFALSTAAPPPPENWMQVGLAGAWRDRPLHPVSLASTTAIGQHLLRRVFHVSAFRPEVRGFHESLDVVRVVAQDPNAIGLFNLSHRNRQVRALRVVDDGGRIFPPNRQAIVSGRYPLDRFLLVYARQTADGGLEPAARDFLEFVLSDAGQAIIGHGRKGYIPLNAQERADERAKLR